MGRDRRPLGELRGLGSDPAPVSAGASQGYGEMARQHPARWSTGQLVSPNKRQPPSPDAGGIAKPPPGTGWKANPSQKDGRSLASAAVWRECCRRPRLGPGGGQRRWRTSLLPTYAAAGTIPVVDAAADPLDIRAPRRRCRLNRDNGLGGSGWRLYPTRLQWGGAGERGEGAAIGRGLRCRLRSEKTEHSVQKALSCRYYWFPRVHS